MICFRRYESPLGDMMLSGDEEGLAGLWFAGDGKPAGGGRNAVCREPACISQAMEWLDIYFEGRDPGFLPEIHWTGSAFRRRVGEIMLGIPYGKTATYGWIARQIAEERGGRAMSAQAVGGAVGRNPVSLIIPCHRVIGANGSLTGYGGGIARKKALLELEGVDVSRFTLPKSQSAGRGPGTPRGI